MQLERFQELHKTSLEVRDGKPWIIIVTSSCGKTNNHIPFPKLTLNILLLEADIKQPTLCLAKFNEALICFKKARHQCCPSQIVFLVVSAYPVMSSRMSVHVLYCNLGNRLSLLWHLALNQHPLNNPYCSQDNFQKVVENLLDSPFWSRIASIPSRILLSSEYI